MKKKEKGGKKNTLVQENIFLLSPNRDFKFIFAFQKVYHKTKHSF